jgi:hypothetical protein
MAAEPTYDLLELDGRCVLAFREWDDVCPPCDVVAKPIAIAVGASADSHYEFRTLRLNAEGQVVRRERDLAASIDSLGRHTDELTGHMRIAGLALIDRWRARPPNAAEQPSVNMAFEALIAAGLHSRLIADTDPKVIGSRLYAGAHGSNDIDLALDLSPPATLALRDAAAAVRRSTGKPARYPFRVPVRDGHVDLLPVMRPGDEHPLVGRTRWVPTGTGEIYIDAVVLDDSCSSYPWPAAIIDRDPRWVVLCSNAFRGLVRAGQRLRGRAIELDVHHAPGTTPTRVALIGDPWSRLQAPVFSE